MSTFAQRCSSSCLCYCVQVLGCIGPRFLVFTDLVLRLRVGHVVSSALPPCVYVSAGFSVRVIFLFLVFDLHAVFLRVLT